MQFGEAGPGVGVDHGFGPPHRLVRRQMLPRVGTKVIAAEDDPGRVETDARSDRLHESAEIGRRHAGVAALLVDLIAGRLDQDAPAGAKRQRQGGLDDDGMGGAYRRDAGPAVGQALADERGKGSSHDEGFPA